MRQREYQIIKCDSVTGEGSDFESCDCDLIKANKTIVSVLVQQRPLTAFPTAGAKDLRAGCHSAKQRLDHLYPFCIVDWHTKRSFLKVGYRLLQIVFMKLFYVVFFCIV